MPAQKFSAWMGIVLSLIGAPLKIARALRQAEPLPFVPTTISPWLFCSSAPSWFFAGAVDVC